MATLGMMYPAIGGLVWGQMKGALTEVRGSTPPIRGLYTGCESYGHLNADFYSQLNNNTSLSRPT